MKKLTKKQKEEIEYNNGFLTAIGLFLVHEREDWDSISKIRDLTFYSATDHLIDIEIPQSLPKKIKDKINKAISEAFKYRLGNPSETEKYKIFQEFKNILKDIDEYLWKKEVCIKYY